MIGVCTDRPMVPGNYFSEHLLSVKYFFFSITANHRSSLHQQKPLNPELATRCPDGKNTVGWVQSTFTTAKVAVLAHFMMESASTLTPVTQMRLFKLCEIQTEIWLRLTTACCLISAISTTDVASKFKFETTTVAYGAWCLGAKMETVNISECVGHRRRR